MRYRPQLSALMLYALHFCQSVLGTVSAAVGLPDCTSLLLAAYVQYLNFKMLGFFVFYALPPFLLFLPSFQEILFSALQHSLRAAVSVAEKA